MSATTLGVIGYGIMGERLLRAAVAHESGAIAVAGVWDPSPAAMARLAADLPGVPRLADADAVLAAADCIYVASPPRKPRRLCGRRPGARARRLLREASGGRSPFGARPRGCLRGAGRARGRQLSVRSSPAVDQLAAWLKDDGVGAVRRVAIEIAFADWPRPWQPTPPHGSTGGRRAASPARWCPISCSCPAACSGRCGSKTLR
jgi:hypothetical protein